MTYTPTPEMIEAFRRAFNRIGVDLWGISSYEFKDALTIALASDPLIAAAPELLEALKQIVSDIREYEHMNNLAPNPGRQDCWDSVTLARAAIAKAENRS